MMGITGIKQSFFGNLTINNNTAPRQELNHFSLLNKPIKDSISFGTGKSTRDKFKVLRQIAVMFGLPDFYTGKILRLIDGPTIEHLIPQGKKTRQHAKDIGLTSVNSLGNIVVTAAEINHNVRKAIPLADFYKDHPDYLENGKKALKEYEKVNLKAGELFDGSPAINGKDWVQRLKPTLNTELGYLAFSGKKFPKDQKLSYNA